MPRFDLKTITIGLIFYYCFPPITAFSKSFDFPTAPVESGVWKPTIRAQGQVMAEREIVLSLPFATLIKTVQVYGDQSVKQGQVLATIDASPLITLFANLQTADKRVELARQHLKITQTRFANKLAVRDDLLQAKEGLNIALRDLTNDWQTTNNVLLLMGQTTSETALLKQLKEASPDLIALRHAEIRAPFDGIVAKRFIGSGARIASGEPLFVLDDMSHVFITILIPPHQLTQWKKGEVFAKTDTDAVTLALLSNVPSIDPTSGLVKLYFQADNPKGFFLDGEWLDVILQSDPIPVFWVPQSAVVERNGKTYCIRQKTHGFDTIEVNVGEPVDHRIPVISGLQQDDRVVVSNAYLLLYRDLKDIMKRAAD